MQHGETEAPKNLAAWGGGLTGGSGLEWSRSREGLRRCVLGPCPSGALACGLVEVEQGQLCKGHCIALGGTRHSVIIQISTGFWKILVIKSWEKACI